MQLPDWLYYKEHSVKCSVASGTIAEGQDVLFESDNDAEDAPI